MSESIWYLQSLSFEWKTLSPILLSWTALRAVYYFDMRYYDMECRIRGFILNKRSVSFFQWCCKAFGCVQLAYTWYKIMWNIRLRANKIKQNKQTKQTNKQKNNWTEGFKELLLLMTVLDLLLRRRRKSNNALFLKSSVTSCYYTVYWLFQGCREKYFLIVPLK